MINASRLLQDLKRLLGTLEDDLRERCREVPEVDAAVRAEYERARQAKRTAHAYEIWREGHLTQAGVAWILACVFVRFLEDNRLVDVPYLSGPGPRLALARDHHTHYFSLHPRETDREYLHFVFGETARLPALGALLGERHNPLFGLGLSADGARALLDFWRRPDPDTGEIVHDFTDPGWNTRFLGDLYQDLSEDARKTYALLQTPVFVEEFILDRTLEPAIQEFGYQAVRLIDPACGSGHFLLGAFRRLLDRWLRDEPATNPRALAQRALDAVYGVDLNPFAVAIARFRLLLSALQACGVTRMADAPDFRTNLAVGDSLLHGSRPRLQGARQEHLLGDDPIRHVYEAEDADELRRILGQRYHVVVGNPPYITPKDPALNEAYRERFGSCYRQYSLGVPFTERFFDLALAPEAGASVPAGFVGTITANSFMKREFGKKLIEEFIPRWDLTHVVDTSGAYVPGHGTPTVILFARHRAPLENTVRAVMGIRGEPQTPQDPAKGHVWLAILAQIDDPGSQSDFVSATDIPRERFHSHPWSVGGGGAAELKVTLTVHALDMLADCADSIGFFQDTHADEAFVQPDHFVRRRGLASAFREHVRGEDVRDWSLESSEQILFPYNTRLELWQSAPDGPEWAWLWAQRTGLWSRSTFGGGNYRSAGRRWFDYHQFPKDRARTALSIAFAEVATHNHFVLDRGGKVFNRTAPVIKLAVGATEDEHLGLLGLLNSSVACFWLRQVCFPKGGDHVGTEGARVRKTLWEERFAFNASNLESFPVPVDRPVEFGRHLFELAAEHAALSPNALVSRGMPRREGLNAARQTESKVFGRMIALQEELDWQCYRTYGLLPDVLCHGGVVPEVRLGERAFEIVMARRLASNEIETTWFQRHRSTPSTEIPALWPEEYRRLVERRIEVIESNTQIALIEQPECKRRWSTEPWEEREARAVRGWLLDRLEDGRYWPEPRLTSCARLADHLHQDAEFMQVAEVYTGRPDFDLTRVVTELVEAEAVPFLPALRYTDPGLLKRAAWDETWTLQRREDAIDARSRLPVSGPGHLTQEQAEGLKATEVGDIPVPPKYTAADFRHQGYWRLRGKLDVPKERFILYPNAEREGDPTPVIGWAGWDALEQARALAGYLVEMRETEGWSGERLAPLLAGLVELLPWLRQWHNDVDPAYGIGMGDYFAQFVDEEARAIGVTVEALRAWTPPKPKARTKQTKKKAT